MTDTTRRRFLQTAVAAGVATGAASAIEPIRRVGRPQFRLSLAAYSYRQYLNLQKPTMTLAEFIDAAALMPLDAVELTGYYFRETTPQYLAGLKGRCTRLGLDVSGTAVRSNFCLPDARLKTEIDHTRQWIEHTARLGGKTIRIFAGTAERGDTEERARARCVEAIEAVCEHASQYGVYVALENHGGITTTVEQILTLVRAVKSEWFGVNLDTGNFRTADPYSDLNQLAPYAVNVQMKTEITRQGQKPEDADLRRLFDMLRKVSYRGYVALEYEAAEEPRVAVPRHVEALRKLCQ